MITPLFLTAIEKGLPEFPAFEAAVVKAAAVLYDDLQNDTEGALGLWAYRVLTLAQEDTQAGRDVITLLGLYVDAVT